MSTAAKYWHDNLVAHMPQLINVLHVALTCQRHRPSTLREMMFADISQRIDLPKSSHS